MFKKIQKNLGLDHAMAAILKQPEFQKLWKVEKIAHDNSAQGTVLQLLDISEDLDKLGATKESLLIAKIASGLMSEGAFTDEDDEYTRNIEEEILNERKGNSFYDKDAADLEEDLPRSMPDGFGHFDMDEYDIPDVIDKKIESNLPEDYEQCGTCGFDHSYDESDPTVYEKMRKAHKKEDGKHSSNFADIYDTHQKSDTPSENLSYENMDLLDMDHDDYDDDPNNFFEFNDPTY